MHGNINIGSGICYEVLQLANTVIDLAFIAICYLVERSDPHFDTRTKSVLGAKRKATLIAVIGS